MDIETYSETRMEEYMQKRFTKSAKRVIENARKQPTLDSGLQRSRYMDIHVYTVHTYIFQVFRCFNYSEI